MIVQRTAFALMAGAALAVTTLASPATGWADEADQGVADSALAPACPDQVFDSKTGTCIDPLAKLASDLSSAANLPSLPDASTLASNLAGTPGLINPNVSVPVSVGLPGIGLPPIALPQGGTPQMPQLPALPPVGLPALPPVGLPALPGPPQLCGPKIDTPIPFVGFQPCI
jgi:hypothetical protein